MTHTYAHTHTHTRTPIAKCARLGVTATCDWAGTELLNVKICRTTASSNIACLVACDDCGTNSAGVAKLHRLQHHV